MTERAWEEKSHDIIYSSDVAISRAHFEVSSNVEAVRRSASTYTSYASRQTAFRSSCDIFYSAKHIFAAEHVLAFRKRSTCMRILESLSQESLQKESLRHQERTKMCDRLSFFREIGFVIFQLRRRTEGKCEKLLFEYSLFGKNAIFLTVMKYASRR